VNGKRPGSWYVHSDKDARWNKHGRAEHLVVTAGGCKDMQDWIAECIEKYGAPPDDCVHGCMKD
jgi:hypothetical protein